MYKRHLKTYQTVKDAISTSCLPPHATWLATNRRGNTSAHTVAMRIPRKYSRDSTQQRGLPVNMIEHSKDRGRAGRRAQQLQHGAHNPGERTPAPETRPTIPPHHAGTPSRPPPLPLTLPVAACLPAAHLCWSTTIPAHLANTRAVEGAISWRVGSWERGLHGTGLQHGAAR